jgi:hypothetical protein
VVLSVTAMNTWTFSTASSEQAFITIVSSKSHSLHLPMEMSRFE